MPHGDAEDAGSLGNAPTVASAPDDGPRPAPEATAVSTAETGGPESLGSAASLLRGIAAAPGGAADDGPLHAGQIVGGKYLVVRPIGAGGMGFVYLARDARLDRDVAIKVGSAVSSVALARLEREAQALARLSHPNVVVVYEVGEVEGRVFVAMEHVAGGTARAWARARPRTAREVLALYAAAGDGLAAAHAAGIVHRDFKPDNVLVGDDGRPRVADFGLARGLADDGAADDDAGRSPLVDVTRTGAIAGTPAYMAPEQHAGDAVDARADQFAFCAALWEALYGVRPFGGATPAQVAEAIESSEPRTAPPAADGRGPGARPRKVPRHVDAALRRGLRRAPAARWPAMAPLVAELRRDPARRRRNLLLAAGAAAAVAAAAIVPLAVRGGGPEPCPGDDGTLAALWNDARAARIGAAFAAAGGGATWAHVRPRIDAYARALAVARHDACKATRVDGTQSEAILDRRMLCLGAARDQLAQVLAGYDRGGRDAVAHAPQELALLSDLGPCADVVTLTKQAPLPANPVARHAIERAYQDVASLRHASIRGGVRDPAQAGDRVLATAKATDWPPVVATAASLRATVLLDGGERDAGRKAMADAISLQLAAADDDGAAWSMADLAWDLAAAEKVDEADHWLQLARPLWERTGKDPGLGARLLAVEATEDIVRGKYTEAVDVAKRQQVLTRQAYGDDAYNVAAGHYNLELAYARAGRWPDAAREGRLALTSVEVALGKDHPTTGLYLAFLAEDEGRLGKLEDGRNDYRRAIAILEAWYGPDDVHVGREVLGLARIEVQRGDEAAARTAYDRAIAIERAHDPSSPNLPNLETNVGVMLAQFGHLAEARPYAEHALGEHVALLGPDNADLNSDYILLAFVDRGLGRLADAEREDREAVRVVERTFGAKDPNAVNPRIELSYTLVAEGKAAEAAALLEPMVALADSSAGVAPPAAAEVHTAYADALWRAHGDRARARAAATQGRDAFAALGEGFEGQRKQADAWLAAHRVR